MNWRESWQKNTGRARSRWCCPRREIVPDLGDSWRGDRGGASMSGHPVFSLVAEALGPADCRAERESFWTDQSDLGGAMC